MSGAIVPELLCRGERMAAWYRVCGREDQEAAVPG